MRNAYLWDVERPASEPGMSEEGITFTVLQRRLLRLLESIHGENLTNLEKLHVAHCITDSQFLRRDDAGKRRISYRFGEEELTAMANNSRTTNVKALLLQAADMYHAALEECAG